MSEKVTGNTSALGGMTGKQSPHEDVNKNVDSGRSQKPAGIDRDGVIRSGSSSNKFGRGPVGPDPRKFKYDRLQGAKKQPIRFSASRADRLDADLAGELLNKIHREFGIDTELEDKIMAFDKALFFEHAVNGASMLQPGRGSLVVGQGEDASVFELDAVRKILGVDARRFFRAFADEVIEVVKEVLASYDPYDHALVEMYGQVQQMAVQRGLQKYPHLIADSSEAATRITLEERVALMSSKRSVIGSTLNKVDLVNERAVNHAERDIYISEE